jgi:hypothetical protein
MERGLNRREEASNPLGLSSKTVLLRRGRMPESKYPCTGRITELLQGVLTRKSLGEWENSPGDIVTN